MPAEFYRFDFEPCVPLDEVEATLHLAMVSLEGLCGAASIRLDAAYQVDTDHHAIVIDARSAVGMALARVFANLLQHEIGDDRFHVRRTSRASVKQLVEVG